MNPIIDSLTEVLQQTEEAYMAEHLQQQLVVEEVAITLVPRLVPILLLSIKKWKKFLVLAVSIGTQKIH